MAKLVYGSQGRHFKLTQELVVIGRSEDFAQLAINDKRLSRKHAELTREGGAWKVKDLGSRNGTRVNNRAVLEHVLKDGDEISLGGLTFKFLEEDAAPKPQPAAPKPDPDAKHPAPPGAAYSLKLLQGTLNNVLIPISNFPFTVGRKPGNDLVLDGDKQSSGAHARFELLDDGTVMLVDLNSTNGSKVDGKAIKRAVLSDGAKVLIGSQLFRFDAGAGGAADATPVGGTAAQGGGVGLELDGNDSPGLMLDDDEGAIQFASSQDGAEIIPPPSEIESELGELDSIGAGELDDPALDELDDDQLDAAPAKPIAPAKAKGKAKAAAPGSNDETQAIKSSSGDDLSKLDQIQVDSAGTGSGRAVMVLNAVLGLFVLGAIAGFFYLTLSKGGISGPTGTQWEELPLGEGGLLSNHSFEGPAEVDPGTSISGWSQIENFQYDNARAEPNSGKGGRQVLAIQRQGPSRERTLWVNDTRFSIPGRSDDQNAAVALQGSVWISASEGQASAFLFMDWFSDKDPVNPMRRDYRGYIAAQAAPSAAPAASDESGEVSAASNDSSGQAEKWQQTSAVFFAPKGAKRARFGIGLTGGLGTIFFDEANVVGSSVEEGTRLTASSNLGLSMDQDGSFSAVSLRDESLIERAWLEFNSASARDQGLRHYEWLVSQPSAARSGEGLVWTMQVFDPEAARARDLSISVRESTLKVNLGDGGATGVRFVMENAANLMPSGVVALRDGRGLKCGSEISTDGVDRIEFCDATHAIEMSGAISSKPGVLALYSAGQNISASFELGAGERRLAELLALYGEADEDGQRAGLKRIHETGPSQLDSALRRELVENAMSLAAEFPAHREAVALARRAVVEIASFYQIKSTDLGDVVGAGRDLVRNVDLYLDAIDRALTYRSDLQASLQAWVKASDPFLKAYRERGRSGMPDENYDAMREMVRKLSEMGAALPGEAPRSTQTALGSFQEIVKNGEERAFQLKVERQIVDARPELASALDHVRVGNNEQARLKLYSIIERFPLSDAATEAQMSLLDVAQAHIKEAKESETLGLSRIASSQQAKAKEIIRFVRISRDKVALNAFSTIARKELFDRLEANAREIAGPDVPLKELRVLGVLLEDWRRRDREVNELVSSLE